MSDETQIEIDYCEDMVNLYEPVVKLANAGAFASLMAVALTVAAAINWSETWIDLILYFWALLFSVIVYVMCEKVRERANRSMCDFAIQKALWEEEARR